MFLTFHKIGPDNDFLNMSVTIEDFTKLIESLKNNFTLISFDDAIDILERKKIDTLYFSITFDDGFKDNKLTFDYLKSINVKPALFVSVNAIDGKETFWFEKLKLALKDEDKLFNYIGKTDFEKVLSYLKSVPLGHRQDILDNFLKSIDPPKELDQKETKFTWNELAQLVSENYISIGSHGMHHESLKYYNENEIRFELGESKKIIKDKIGISVDTYSFPNGSKEDIPCGVSNLLKEFGYKCSFSLIPGLNKSLSFKIKRINITMPFLRSNTCFDKNMIYFNLINKIW